MEFKKTPKVLPVQEDFPDPSIKPVHPNIPQPPALLLAIGAVKSGKTTLINSLFFQTREDGFFGQDYFQNVKIISNTISNDPTARFLKKAFDVSDYYRDGDITAFIQKQDSYGERNDMPFTALILDDILGTNMKRNNEISFLATRFRHKHIGLMAVFVQNFKSVDTILRNNATDVIIFKQTNQNQLNQIAEEYMSGFGTKENFLKIYNIATKEKFSFLYLRVGDGQAYKSFEVQIAEGPRILVNDEGMPDIMKDENVEEENI